jgi:hypothetical protein
MQIPAAAFIEQAAEQVTNGTLTSHMYAAQRRELSSVLGITDANCITGYMLGIQTARVMIAASVAVQQSNIKPEDIL